MTSPNPIADAIFAAARRERFPDRILMHPETLYHLLYEQDAHRRILSPVAQGEPYRFCGTPIHQHDDFPTSGFAFQRKCPDCNTLNFEIVTRPVPHDFRCVVRDGRYVCAACNGDRFVTNFESHAWQAEKQQDDTAA